MLLASAKDIRVMIIKLADRLHNMKTLKYLRVDKRKRIAQQTKDIYAPIASKLGMSEIKGELEDLSFRYTEPKAYQSIKKHINKKRGERDAETKKIIDTLNSSLKAKGINAQVFGRAKYFYSIYRKMKEKNKGFNEIYDLIGIRIIVETISECYGALGVVHELWAPEPGRFKDYVALPKANGYQSLHTSVLGDHGKYIEVQIRTEEMHILAEEGVAAHWKYKGTERDKKFEKKIIWLKEILEWKQQSQDAKDFVDRLKIDLFSNEIVTFTPKGDAISLPKNSTPIDFAYMVHSKLGDICYSTKVNNVNVPLDVKLKSGDVVEILTRKNAKPSRQWLNFVVTGKAKSKIRQALNIVVEHNPKRARMIKESKSKFPEAQLSKQILTSSKHPVKLSKCCTPNPGDPIVGYLTKDKKVTIHKIDCPNRHAVESDVQIDVKWKTKKPISTLMIIVQDKIGVMKKILNGLSRYHVKMVSINTIATKTFIKIKVEYERDDDLDMDALLDAIHKLDFVNSAEILN